MTYRNCFKTISLTACLLICGKNPLMAQTLTTTTPAAAPGPTTNWVSSLAAGATLTRGNSDTTTLSLTAQSERKWSVNDLTLEADALYGTSKIAGTSGNTETADSLHGAVQYNRSFTGAISNLYFFGRIEGLHDGIADIQYRLTFAPGLGYFLIKKKTIDLSLEAGPAWIDEKLGNEYLNYATLFGAEKFHYVMTDWSRFFESIEIFPQVDNFDNYIINFEAGFEVDLNKKQNLAFRVVLDDTYNNVPAPGREKNDLKLIASIAYKF